MHNSFRKGFTPTEFSPFRELRKLFHSMKKNVHRHEQSSAKIPTGFTLVELIIVIAILAVMTAVVVIVLNPGELLAQARDAQRINDLETLRAALATYIALVPNLDLGACPAGGTCTFNPGAGLGPFDDNTCSAVSTANNITGTGWVSVNLIGIPGGSPVASLPIDPVNNATYFYGYGCRETPRFVFELTARLESQKHRGEMAFDGGDRNCLCNGAACDNTNIGTMTAAESVAVNCFYETGTAAELNL